MLCLLVPSHFLARSLILAHALLQLCSSHFCLCWLSIDAVSTHEHTPRQAHQYGATAIKQRMFRIFISCVAFISLDVCMCVSECVCFFVSLYTDSLPLASPLSIHTLSTAYSSYMQYYQLLNSGLLLHQLIRFLFLAWLRFLLWILYVCTRALTCTQPVGCTISVCDDTKRVIDVC